MSLRVLLVEDDPDARELLALVLEGLGHQVVGCVDGRDALAHTSDPAARFDAAVLDLQMPRLDGIELVRRLRRHAHTRELPIVCVSARADARSREGALAAGADAFLTKPLPLDRIVQALLEQVARRGAPSQDRAG